MHKTFWRGRALLAVLLLGAVAGCGFIEPVTANPNAVPNANLDQLFVGVQVNGYLQEEGQTSRLASVWLQQMAGTDRQFSSMDQYVFTENDVSAQYVDIFGGGGMVDMRKARRLAVDDNRPGYLGILKLYEAYFVGMAASIFGDVSYSEAVDPDIAEPKLDNQADVYAAVQQLLTSAISDMTTGGGQPVQADFAYGGDLSKWIALAHTLKARFYLHWAEADVANYGAALAEAQQGILASSGDFVAQHSTASTENNLWYQFMRDREGYISAGEYGVNQLQTRNDARLQKYYSPGRGGSAGTYVGSPVGEPAGDCGTDCSRLSEDPGGAGRPEYDFPIVTCAENNFIIAEALFRTGATDAQVRTALDAGIACDAARKGLDLSAAQAANDALTGAALFDEVMAQKYMALFLNREVWNDYKRTCRPAITTYNGLPIPGRLFYDNEERQSNSNIPDATQQPLRNANDPSPC